MWVTPHMAGAVQNTNGEFWRAPVSTPVADPVSATELPEVCPSCSSEFVVSAGFCHVCGAQRSVALPPNNSWARSLELARHLEFHYIKERIGLRTLSMVFFLVGVTCALAALLVGFIFTANTVLDWQAVQIWRIEWLLGAAAAFLAGILLKRS